MNATFTRASGWAAALALVATSPALAAAPANQPPCLDQADVSAILAYGLPTAMDTAMTFCAPHLAPQGFFARDGRALVQRYAAAKPAAWPQAKAALLKLANGTKDPTVASFTRLPDSALQPVADGMVGQLVTEKLKPDACRPLETAIRLVAPLPPENTAGILSFMLRLAEQPRQNAGTPARKTGLPLCPADL